MSKKVVVASGYFDPMHYGHVEYLQKTQMKKGQPFMNANERVKLVRALECVDAAVIAVDEDRTVCKTLSLLHPDIFTNGGDQTNQSIPEAKVCNELGIQMADGLGGKVQSSSWLLARSRGDNIVVKDDPNQ
eukprot:maker-scaffold_14-snap-gene-5.59-mRNA-1 protein AED:0.07 eAED:0.07 QI:78/0/0.5/1/0/0/2/0/130